MNDYDVIWYDGSKYREKPVAVMIKGDKVMVKEWKPLGIVVNFLGSKREVHKVKLENGLVFKIEYIRSLDIWTVEKSRNF
ncbi:MAG TPA: hypothetical protein ENL43_03745 [candidate division WOR-3 bacterium]|uniref:Uncharacterized protein n=1 Tax=candidate division WOR-3 bacterium TaxID=2052148 RepID=A0A7V5LU86_UNCW3|nr:hypothetical protein [candidate division WOR-3 bacterium]